MQGQTNINGMSPVSPQLITQPLALIYKQWIIEGVFPGQLILANIIPSYMVDYSMPFVFQPHVSKNVKLANYWLMLRMNLHMEPCYESRIY